MGEGGWNVFTGVVWDRGIDIAQVWICSGMRLSRGLKCFHRCGMG